MDYSSVLLYSVYWASKLGSRPVKVGIMSTLSFKGISLVLGYDLAGIRVVTDPILIDKPCLNTIRDPIEDAIRYLYPSCVRWRCKDRALPKPF